MMQDGVLSFHRFPRNHELKAKWMKVIGRKQWPSKWWTAVCSDHFAPEDFVSGHAALGMLKPKAVPSVFWDKGSPVVTQARRAPRKLPAGSSRIQTIDTASPHGEETNAPESSALAEASTFIVVALNSPTTSADVPSTPVRTSGNDSSHHDVAATAHQTTSGEQPKGLAMTGPTLPHESAPNLGVQDVAECGRQQKVLMVRTATSDERESSTLQVMEPEPQTGAAEKPAAAPEAHQSGAQQADGQLVTAPTTPAGAQQRTFQRKDLTKIFVEIRKRLVGKYPQGQCSPFMLCAECKEPLLQAAATSDTSAGSTSKTQRKDIVAKLRERALNSQVTTWTSDEVVSVDFEQPAESPSSAPVQDKPVGTSSPSAADLLAFCSVLADADGAVLKCCVPSCTNRSDEPRHQPLAFYR
ncbi:hypothetical protein HPB49_016928 [Dermacentor silvarum]|uniref:Uncharacterized protein n=1 Tax=Dermacentor silvarum TaxID=543639 RepID=A0ACB8CGB3_DERSI|nr:hypothetical protein HPB49_016928 [Dermacentor silvarum]